MVSRRSGFTLVELLMVVAVICILMGVVVPGLMRARLTANEASAIASLRSVNSGQQAFWSSCGGGMYSPSLGNLGSRVNGAVGYLSPDLSVGAPPTKSGYQFDLGTTAPAVGTRCNGGTVASSYHVTADFMPGRGSRYFGSNGHGTLYESIATLSGVMPDQAPPPAPATALMQ